MTLMTGIAQGCCGSHCGLIIEKVAAKLSMLPCQPMALPGFKATITNLRFFWVRLLAQGNPPAGADQVETSAGHSEPLGSQPKCRWGHPAPETI